jgi:murein DD-endopeptidase MepM/ murein hydrolase activator NlpD
VNYFTWDEISFDPDDGARRTGGPRTLQKAPECGSRGLFLHRRPFRSRFAAGPGHARIPPVRRSEPAGPEPAWTFAFPRPDFAPGSYEGRTFLNPSNHLGEDSEHRHHDSVHAIADGRVVVVEHRLPDGSSVCSIYGHLCSHSGYSPVRDGSRVKRGGVVGYVGDRFENGDGLEHLHLGLRKGRYDGHFCGYARTPHCTPKHYHRPSEFIRARSGALRLTSEIETFSRPGERALTFKAGVTNGFFYGGSFELRLRVLAGGSVRFTSEAQTKKLAPGASACLQFPSPLTDARAARAELDLRPPGATDWRPVESAVS